MTDRTRYAPGPVSKAEVRKGVDPAQLREWAFDVLDHLLSGAPIGRLAGGDVMQLGAWQRLRGEYTKQFANE